MQPRFTPVPELLHTAGFGFKYSDAEEKTQAGPILDQNISCAAAGGSQVAKKCQQHKCRPSYL